MNVCAVSVKSHAVYHQFIVDNTVVKILGQKDAF